MEPNPTFPNGFMTKMKLSDGSIGFGGEVKIPRLVHTKVRFRLNTDKRGEQSPDYWVDTPYHDGKQASWEPSGAAWVKTPRAGGDEFFSVNLDMADMPAAVNFAAFLADKEHQPEQAKDGVGEKWRFTYSRPRQAKRTPQSRPLELDDEIAF